MEEGATEKVAEWWRRTPEARAAERRTNWLEHPRLLHHTAGRVTGNPFGEAWRWAVARDHRKPVERMLSLGCGGGGLERRVLKTRWARHVDGIDVSPGAIEQARAAARSAGISDRVAYRVADLDTVELEAATYDVVVAQMSVHHVTELEHVYEEVARALRPGGTFVLNEYTGPTRRQLPDAQIALIDEALSGLPEARRVRASDGTVKERHERIDLGWFDANDPSESVRSAEIMPLLRERMDVTVERPYGGGLLQFLLEDIVWCFGGVSGRRDLGRLASEELRLEAEGLLGSDFTVAIARPR